MVSLLSSRSRSIDLLARCVIILFVCSLTAVGQAQQVVLGTQQVEASLDNDNSQMAEAFPVTATSSAQVNSLSLFLDGSNSASTVWVGLYSNYSGHPNTLLSQAALTQPLSGKWNSVNIPSVQVKLGTRYWVALLGLNGQIAFRDVTGRCYSETSQQTTLSSLPATWRTGSRWSTCVVSMFGSASTNTSSPVSVSVSVSPTTAALQVGQQKQFTGTISGATNTAVTWKASGGTVTSGGLYTAPSSAGTYTVTATSAADATKSATAVVTASQATQVSISVAPSTVSLSTGGQKQFTASVSGSSNTAVTWAASGGSVTSGGLYTAPSSAGTYTVTATSAADPTKSASAVVTVSQPAQVSVSISPTTASISTGAQKQFAASVSGSTNTAVTWAASGGSVTSGGLYTAPSSAGTYTVTATSAADSTKSASAAVTVSQPTQVSISVSPSTATLSTGAQKQFAASVSGSTNTAVTWTASGGSVTSGGLYTAPSSAGTYTVTATSAADSTKSASAAVTVSQPTQVSISVSPSTVSLSTGGQAQFTANVSGTSNTAVTWSASGGTVSTSGLYVAPSAAGTYTIKAVSVADPTKSASATASVSVAQAIAVSVSPTTVAMPQKWQQQFAATVSGSSNTAVTWSVKQGTGTITQSGLYTAPQAVETDVITATSQADSTKSASGSVTVVAPHTVSLKWSASTSSNISYYKVYRGTVSGGPYSLLSNNVGVTSYTDTSVQSGSTYYYVTTVVDSSGIESGYSDVAQAVVPTP